VNKHIICGCVCGKISDAMNIQVNIKSRAKSTSKIGIGRKKINSHVREGSAGDAISKEEMVQLLVARSQKGESIAFGKLYDQYVNQIYRYIYFRVPKDDVEDLTEMVFLKAWEKIHQYKPGKKSFAAWIFRIAHNLVVDTYRYGKDKETVELSPNVPEHRREHNPIRTTEDRLHSGYLKGALGKIKPQYKQVIVLKFINELSNTEISQVMNKTEGSIRILQFRALKALKIELESEGIDFM